MVYDFLLKIWTSSSILGKLLLGFFFSLFLLSIAAPLFCGPDLLIPFGPNQSIEGAEYLRPFSKDSLDKLHVLGTDRFGRDVLVRLLFASRTAISVGLGVVLISGILAIFFGVLSGYIGNKNLKINLLQVIILLIGVILTSFYLRYGYILIAIFLIGIYLVIFNLLNRLPLMRNLATVFNI